MIFLFMKLEIQVNEKIDNLILRFMKIIDNKITPTLVYF